MAHDRSRNADTKTDRYSPASTELKNNRNIESDWDTNTTTTPIAFFPATMWTPHRKRRSVALGASDKDRLLTKKAKQYMGLEIRHLIQFHIFTTPYLIYITEAIFSSFERETLTDQRLSVASWHRFFDWTPSINCEFCNISLTPTGSLITRAPGSTQ